MRVKLKPSRRVMVGAFESEGDALAAVRTARAQGLAVIDVYTPYPVHGMEDAMGLPRVRWLPRLCLAAGLLGAVLKLAYEFWTATINWPVNVGGKPWNSTPAFIPVTFEVMVLAAAVTTLFAFLIARRLWPGKRARMPLPGVTDGRFVVVLEEGDATFEPHRVRRLLEDLHAVFVEEQREEAP